MIGFVGNSDVGVRVVWLGYVHGWCLYMVDAIGLDRLVGRFGRGVTEV